MTSAEPVAQSASAHGGESTAGLECLSVCAEIDDVSADILSGIRCLAGRSLSSLRLVSQSAVMFSFFRRGKSKDDSDKKEKSKDKSFSPFSKRDTNKQEQSAQKANPLFRDSSLTPGPSEIQTANYDSNPTPENETLTTLNGLTETQDTNLTDIPHVETPKTDDSKDEQQYLLNCKYSRTVTDSTISSPAVDVKEVSESPVSDRAGSSDGDVVYKTAPNTPVLPKHLAVIDKPDLVSDCPGTWSPLGEDSNFPSADGEESSDADSNVVVLGDLEEIVLSELDRSAEECRDRSGAGRESARMCEEMSHGPGELYDIAEEETSEDEDEEESEQEEDDEDDDDEDSGNVTQPTIEEEYPEEIVKYVVSLFVYTVSY